MIQNLTCSCSRLVPIILQEAYGLIRSTDRHFTALFPFSFHIFKDYFLFIIFFLIVPPFYSNTGNLSKYSGILVKQARLIKSTKIKKNTYATLKQNKAKFKKPETLLYSMKNNITFYCLIL